MSLWRRLTGPQRVSLLLIVAAMTAAGIFLVLFERIEEKQEVGLSGEARINDYFAVERLLVAMDVPADSTWGLSAFPEDGALLLLEQDLPFREAIADDLVAWVAAGGTAVIAAAPQVDDPLLQALEFEYALVDDTGALDVSAIPIDTFIHGAGWVAMVPEPGRYTNERISEPGHAAELWHALTLGGTPSQATLIIRGDTPSLLASLWRTGWPALTSLLVLVLAACWRAGARLGPLLPDPDTDRRSIIEHIEATGVFLWRQGHSAHLLDAARRAADQPPTGEPITDPGQFTAEVQRLQQEWTLADRHRDH